MAVTAAGNQERRHLERARLDPRVFLAAVAAAQVGFELAQQSLAVGRVESLLGDRELLDHVRPTITPRSPSTQAPSPSNPAPPSQPTWPAIGLGFSNPAVNAARARV